MFTIPITPTAPADLDPDLLWMAQVATEVARIIGATNALYRMIVPAPAGASPEILVMHWPTDPAAANAAAQRLADYMAGRLESMPATASPEPAFDILPCVGALSPSEGGGLAATAQFVLRDALPTGSGLLSDLFAASVRAHINGFYRCDILRYFVTRGLALVAHWKLSVGGTRKEATSLIRGIVDAMPPEPSA